MSDTQTMRNRVVVAAKSFASACHGTMTVEDIPSGVVHELFDSVRALERCEVDEAEVRRFREWWLKVGISHMPKGDRSPEHGAIAELAWMAALKEPR